jgi:cytidine deaminase
LAVSEAGRLSVSLVDVAEGREADFLALAHEFEALVARKGYARVEIIRDESSERRYYAVRHWTSAAAAEACHADAEVQAITVRLYEVSRVSHIVNGVRRADAMRALLDERRSTQDSDRRAGFDRRQKNIGRPEGDRRSGRDRRLGPRRLRERTGPWDLLAAARRARENAEAPISRFRVGAALEAADGSLIVGCNIENASLGLTMCAERVAMYKALSDRHRAFTRIAIVADGDAPTPPCGACRQILWEFGGNLEVLLGTLTEAKGTYRLEDLLPLPFDARLLPRDQTENVGTE